MNSKQLLAVGMATLAGLILWRLSSKVPAAVGFDRQGMVLKEGACTEKIPVKSLQTERIGVDSLEIVRRVLTLYDGSTLVDEKITLPSTYTFDKPIEALLGELFAGGRVARLRNGKRAAAYEVRTSTGRFGVVAVYKGKSDLELIYPLRGELLERMEACLVEGRKVHSPLVLNRIGEEEDRVPMAEWNDALFVKEVIVNKDM